MGNKSLILNKRKQFSNRDEETVTRFFEELEEEFTDSTKLKVGSKNMIVTSYPFMKEFEGTRLIGAFEFDSEGVSPEEELILIDNGYVKQKLNGRTPIPYALKSTGHNRLSTDALSGAASLIAPGVLKIDFREKVKDEEVIKIMDERMVSEELEFGMVIDYPKLTSTRRPKQYFCLLYTSPSPRDLSTSRMPSSA